MASQCVIGTYDSLPKAEAAIDALQRAGYTPGQISLVAPHFSINGQVMTEQDLGDDSLRDAAIGGVLGGTTGALGAAGLIAMTGAGVLLLAGPLVALTGAIVGALVGAMKGWGVHEAQIEEYQERLKEGDILVIVTGDPPAVERATELLRATDVLEVTMHARAADDSPEVDDRPAALRN